MVLYIVLWKELIQMDMLLLLLIVKILISVLIHLGIVFPIILIHTFDVFPNRLDRLPYFPNLLPEFFCHLIQKLCASRHIVLPFLHLIFTRAFLPYVLS